MNYLSAKTVSYSVLYLQSLTLNTYPTIFCEWMNRSMNKKETHCPRGEKKSKCTPYWRPVASLDWKSNCQTNITNVMNDKDKGVFYWTPELGGTCTSGKSCALEPERQNFLCVSPVLFSLHLLYSLPANQLSQLLKTISDMWPLICTLHFQSNSVAWPSWLQFQIPEREKNLIGSALLMIPGLVQRAMTRGCHAVEM